MIIPDFLVLDVKGLYCRTGDFYLDPQLPVATAVISHAHADHAVAGNHKVYCTPPTAAVMELRYRKNAAAEFCLMAYHMEFSINGVSIRFIPAGHILGSAQVLLEYSGTRYLYTGDYKLQPDTTCEPYEWVRADVLITETTFADPGIKHPDPVTEISKFNSNIHNILLGAYSLGKSQRLISLINKYCPQRQVLVHHSILPVNKIYESYSYPPGKYEMYNRKLMKEPDRGYVYLVPPTTFNSYFRAKNVLRIFASGWKGLQFQNNMELFISDHADWDDILETIKNVQPAEIWTLHGDGRFLRDHYENKLPVKLLSVAERR